MTVGGLQALNEATALGFAAVGRSQYYARLALNPMQPPYNAAGDGVTDDTSAMLAVISAALATGYPVDGRGRTYAVTSLAPTMFDGLEIRNATFKGLTPDLTTRKTLAFIGTGVEKLTLKSVVVNRNGSGTSGALNTSGGIWIESVDGLLLDRCEVYGNNKGNGIAVLYSKNITVIKPHVHDIRFTDLAVTDDVIQGMWFYLSSDIAIDTPRTENFGLQDQTSAIRDNYNRGIVFGGCKRFVVTSPLGYRVSQWIDVSGSVDSQDGSIVGGVGRYILNNGVKFSNSSVCVTATGTIVEQAGAYAFVVGAPSEVQENPSREVKFTGCIARNTGASGQGNSYGFGFINGAGYVNSPKSVQAIGCSAISDEGAATFTVSSGFTLLLNLATPITVTDGVRVRLTTSGTLPSGLALATDYWLTNCGNNGIVSLATSHIRAISGIPITGISGGSGTHTLTLAQNMIYGAIATGTAGFDGGAPIDLVNFRCAGYTGAATNGIAVPFCNAVRNVTHAIANATWQPLAPNAINYDPFGLSNYSLAFADFTASESKMWTFQVIAQWASSATGIRGLKMQIDTGGGYVDIPNFIDKVNNLGAGDTVNQSLSWTGFLARGHKIQACGYQSSGGPLNTVSEQFLFFPTSDRSGGV